MLPLRTCLIRLSRENPEVKNSKKMELCKKSITDMSGLDDFYKLEELNLSQNLISAIHGLKKMHGLKVLNLSHNKIKEISGLPTTLRKLRLGGNMIREIKGLNKCFFLEELSLENNLFASLTGLPTIGSSMTKLFLSSNSISNLSGIDKLYNLQVLALDGNLLKSIKGLEENTQLEFLNLSGNAIRKLTPLYGMKKLKSLLIKSMTELESNGMMNIVILSTFVKNGGNLEFEETRFKYMMQRSDLAIKKYESTNKPYRILIGSDNGVSRPQSSIPRRLLPEKKELTRSFNDGKKLEKESMESKMLLESLKQEKRELLVKLDDNTKLYETLSIQHSSLKREFDKMKKLKVVPKEINVETTEQYKSLKKEFERKFNHVKKRYAEVARLKEELQKKLDLANNIEENEEYILLKKKIVQLESLGNIEENEKYIRLQKKVSQLELLCNIEENEEYIKMKFEVARLKGELENVQVESVLASVEKEESEEIHVLKSQLKEERDRRKKAGVIEDNPKYLELKRELERARLGLGVNIEETGQYRKLKKELLEEKERRGKVEDISNHPRYKALLEKNSQLEKDNVKVNIGGSERESQFMVFKGKAEKYIEKLNLGLKGKDKEIAELKKEISELERKGGQIPGKDDLVGEFKSLQAQYDKHTNLIIVHEAEIKRLRNDKNSVIGQLNRMREEKQNLESAYKVEAEEVVKRINGLKREVSRLTSENKILQRDKKSGRVPPSAEKSKRIMVNNPNRNRNNGIGDRGTHHGVRTEQEIIEDFLDDSDDEKENKKPKPKKKKPIGDDDDFDFNFGSEDEGDNSEETKVDTSDLDKRVRGGGRNSRERDSRKGSKERKSEDRKRKRSSREKRKSEERLSESDEEQKDVRRRRRSDEVKLKFGRNYVPLCLPKVGESEQVNASLQLLFCEKYFVEFLDKHKKDGPICREISGVLFGKKHDVGNNFRDLVNFLERKKIDCGEDSSFSPAAFLKLLLKGIIKETKSSLNCYSWKTLPYKLCTKCNKLFDMKGDEITYQIHELNPDVGSVKEGVERLTGLRSSKKCRTCGTKYWNIDQFSQTPRIGLVQILESGTKIDRFFKVNNVRKEKEVEYELFGVVFERKKRIVFLDFDDKKRDAGKTFSCVQISGKKWNLISNKNYGPANFEKEVTTLCQKNSTASCVIAAYRRIDD